VNRVDAAFERVHSLLLGPLTWGPIAAGLAASGAVTVMPPLLDGADADPPFWPRIADSVNDAASRTQPHGFSRWVDGVDPGRCPARRYRLGGL
jgi:hypothetical protein